MPEIESPAALQEAAMKRHSHLWRTRQASVGVIVMALGTPAGPDDIGRYYTQMRGGRVPSPALAPQHSHLSVGMYRERLAVANTASLPLFVIEHWHLAPDYLDFLTAALQVTLEQMIRKQRGDVGSIDALFTAHSLPSRLLAMNGPYPGQVHETAEAVASRLRLQRWAVAWQSAGRTAESRIGPGLLDALLTLAGRGRAGAVVCLVGFVSDHLEILYDLDIEARQAAERLGLAFECPPCRMTTPAFSRRWRLHIVQRCWRLQRFQHRLDDLYPDFISLVLA